MIAQKTTEWQKQRLGNFTPSQFYRLMTEPKLKADKEAGELSAGAKTYVLERAAEMLTGRSAQQEFNSIACDWGVEYEPIAANLYERVKGVKCQETGYIAHSERVGGSPDRLIEKYGVLEIKCPFTITAHLEHFMMDTLADKPMYYWQCLGYLFITGREWIDFVSYSPHFPLRTRMLIIRISKDDVLDDIALLQKKLEKAEAKLKTILKQL